MAAPIRPTGNGPLPHTSSARNWFIGVVARAHSGTRAADINSRRKRWTTSYFFTNSRRKRWTLRIEIGLDILFHCTSPECVHNDTRSYYDFASLGNVTLRASDVTEGPYLMAIGQSCPTGKRWTGCCGSWPSRQPGEGICSDAASWDRRVLSMT